MNPKDQLPGSSMREPLGWGNLNEWHHPMGRGTELSKTERVRWAPAVGVGAGTSECAVCTNTQISLSFLAMGRKRAASSGSHLYGFPAMVGSAPKHSQISCSFFKWPLSEFDLGSSKGD